MLPAVQVSSSRNAPTYVIRGTIVALQGDGGADDDRIDSLSGNEFDDLEDLFEPFELSEEEPRRQQTATTSGLELHQQPAVNAPYDTLTCQSCGAPNPAGNHHCEQCGARLTASSMPVATPPMARATAGGRAVTVLVLVVVIAGVLALLVNLRGDGDTNAGESSTTTTTTSLTPTTIDRLDPTSVEASSSFPGFGPEHLIDGDNDTYWNDNGLRGVDAELVFRFAQPVQIFDMEIQNLIDDVKFKRNYRIEGYVITVDDLPAIERIGTLEDTNRSQTIEIESIATTELRLRITSTYPAQAVGDDPAFEELALQSVRFFGVPAGTTTTAPTDGG